MELAPAFALDLSRGWDRWDLIGIELAIALLWTNQIPERPLRTTEHFPNR